MGRNWKWKKTQKNVSKQEVCWIWKCSSDFYEFYIPTVMTAMNYTSLLFLFFNINIMLFILLRIYILYVLLSIKCHSCCSWCKKRRRLKMKKIYLPWIVLLFMYLTKWYACCSCYICIHDPHPLIMLITVCTGMKDDPLKKS